MKNWYQCKFEVSYLGFSDYTPANSKNSDYFKNTLWYIFVDLEIKNISSLYILSNLNKFSLHSELLSSSCHVTQFLFKFRSVKTSCAIKLRQLNLECTLVMIKILFYNNIAQTIEKLFVQFIIKADMDIIYTYSQCSFFLKIELGNKYTFAALSIPHGFFLK